MNLWLNVLRYEVKTTDKTQLIGPFDNQADNVRLLA